MTSRDFVYWLQGFMELSETSNLSERQVDMIKNHLNLVFVHEIDPQDGGPEVQTKLNMVHKGTQGVMVRC